MFCFHVSAFCRTFAKAIGGLAQLARALAWHARGHRFEPDILHDDFPVTLVGSLIPRLPTLFYCTGSFLPPDATRRLRCSIAMEQLYIHVDAIALSRWSNHLHASCPLPLQVVLPHSSTKILKYFTRWTLTDQVWLKKCTFVTIWPYCSVLFRIQEGTITKH